MINAKKIYTQLLNDERILSVVNDENIFDSFPNEVTVFPCIIFSDNSQRDIEFADNLPQATSCNLEVHIYTKSLEGYKTTSEIGIVVCDVLKENYFTCTYNTEMQDVQKDVKHRIMNFTREFLC